MESIFRKHWDPKNGYTQQEAYSKKQKVDDAHEVWKTESCWKPAEVVPDPSRETGYMVVIRTKK